MNFTTSNNLFVGTFIFLQVIVIVLTAMMYYYYTKLTSHSNLIHIRLSLIFNWIWVGICSIYLFTLFVKSYDTYANLIDGLMMLEILSIVVYVTIQSIYISVIMDMYKNEEWKKKNKKYKPILISICACYGIVVLLKVVAIMIKLNKRCLYEDVYNEPNIVYDCSKKRWTKNSSVFI